MKEHLEDATDIIFDKAIIANKYIKFHEAEPQTWDYPGCPAYLEAYFEAHFKFNDLQLAVMHLTNNDLLLLRDHEYFIDRALSELRDIAGEYEDCVREDPYIEVKVENETLKIQVTNNY